MKKIMTVIILAAAAATAPFALADDIEDFIRQVYDSASRGEWNIIPKYFHPEIEKAGGKSIKSSAKDGIGDLGRLDGWAMLIKNGEMKWTISGLRIKIVKKDAGSAEAETEYKSTMETILTREGKNTAETWTGRDYFFLKKHDGKWYLRRMEDKSARTGGMIFKP
ncbi:MAG: hypothetical protein MUD12_08995 [Spirochaetes bacterium]|jgi:hypothetical protein|nr:hypothetical protein [Spirochaetota bacterium]